MFLWVTAWPADRSSPRQSSLVRPKNRHVAAGILLKGLERCPLERFFCLALLEYRGTMTDVQVKDIDILRGHPGGEDNGRDGVHPPSPGKAGAEDLSNKRELCNSPA
jgi:hypothetical protein